MKLSDFKKHLSASSSLDFVQLNGALIPFHFHITEIGLLSRHFIDCGGDIHVEKLANIQIWVAEDVDHRLSPAGLLNIIDISEKVLGNEDLEIEIEYQTETIGRYTLEFENEKFMLGAKQTDCLAKAKCGIPQVKEKRVLSQLETVKESCTPGGGCC